MELEALAKISGEIEALGGTLVAIAPQARQFNAALKTEKKLGIDILSDPGNAVAHAYGIRHELPPDLRGLYLKFGLDVPKFNGDDSWTLPMPARYVIDQSGNVCYARVNADYTQRPEPEETLAALREMK
jgi:peroxiredoxin